MTNEHFEELMVKLQNKDMDALREIYEEYSKFVYLTIYYIVGQKENAEDLASDVFVKLWEKADSFKPGYSHRAYIAKIARNAALDFLRKEKRLIPGEADGLEAMPSQEDVEGNAVVSVTVAELMKLLKPLQQQIIHLKFFGYMSLAEIADVLNMPAGTVNWEYEMAKKTMRRYQYE